MPVGEPAAGWQGGYSVTVRWTEVEPVTFFLPPEMFLEDLEVDQFPRGPYEVIICFFILMFMCACL